MQSKQPGQTRSKACVLNDLKKEFFFRKLAFEFDPYHWAGDKTDNTFSQPAILRAAMIFYSRDYCPAGESCLK